MRGDGVVIEYADVWHAGAALAALREEGLAASCTPEPVTGAPGARAFVHRLSVAEADADRAAAVLSARGLLDRATD